MIGNPTEVVLVRMCADGAKPPAERFAYRNPAVAFARIWREEGPKVFGRGMSANVARSVLMSMHSVSPQTAFPAGDWELMLDTRCLADSAVCRGETGSALTDVA